MGYWGRYISAHFGPLVDMYWPISRCKLAHLSPAHIDERESWSLLDREATRPDRATIHSREQSYKESRGDQIELQSAATTSGKPASGMVASSLSFFPSHDLLSLAQLT
jgi:hypothetical protein